MTLNGSCFRNNNRNEERDDGCIMCVRSADVDAKSMSMVCYSVKHGKECFSLGNQSMMRPGRELIDLLKADGVQLQVQVNLDQIDPSRVSRRPFAPELIGSRSFSF